MSTNTIFGSLSCLAVKMSHTEYTAIRRDSRTIFDIQSVEEMYASHIDWLNKVTLWWKSKSNNTVDNTADCSGSKVTQFLIEHWDILIFICACACAVSVRNERETSDLEPNH